MFIYLPVCTSNSNCSSSGSICEVCMSSVDTTSAGGLWVWGDSWVLGVIVVVIKGVGRVDDTLDRPLEGTTNGVVELALGVVGSF
jgi:hypothetical protein